MTERLLVLYDRDCGICAAAAARLARWDRHRGLELLALQAAATDSRALVREVAARHPLHDELHVLDPVTGAVRSGGAAFLEIVERLPGGGLPAVLGRLTPAAWAIGVGYGLVAGNRRAISRALRLETACRVPGGSGGTSRREQPSAIPAGHFRARSVRRRTGPSRGPRETR